MARRPDGQPRFCSTGEQIPSTEEARNGRRNRRDMGTGRRRGRPTIHGEAMKPTAATAPLARQGQGGGDKGQPGRVVVAPDRAGNSGRPIRGLRCVARERRERRPLRRLPAAAFLPANNRWKDRAMAEAEDQSRPWVTVSEAASRSGRHVDAIRSLVRRQRLPARKNNSGQWLVQLPAEDQPGAVRDGL